MKTKQQKTFATQRGAVSLFIVLFTALLFMTITIGFAQLMMRDQQQTTYSDLSESAYDSAMAGVEDAKRALLMQQDCIGSDTNQCNNINAAIAAEQCNTIARISTSDPSADSETAIMQNAEDRRLEQAYTCVKIATDTNDYLGTIESPNIATLIPLRGTGGFDRVVVSWSLSESGGEIDLPDVGSRGLPEDTTAAWPESRPALLRAQLINGGSGFNLADLDTSGRSNTLFLYPSPVGSNNFSFDSDSRRGEGGNIPQLVTCDRNVASGDYACRAELAIGSGAGQGVFLSLAAFYKPTEYKVELRMDDQTVSFAGVQPRVDSTGRANDLFRRVVSRVELGNTFSYPVAALETSGNLCKDFSVTTEGADYRNECTP